VPLVNEDGSLMTTHKMGGDEAEFGEPLGFRLREQSEEPDVVITVESYTNENAEVAVIVADGWNVKTDSEILGDEAGQ
jgi:hypothetical protein